MPPSLRLVLCGLAALFAFACVVHAQVGFDTYNTGAQSIPLKQAGGIRHSRFDRSGFTIFELNQVTHTTNREEGADKSNEHFSNSRTREGDGMGCFPCRSTS